MIDYIYVAQDGEKRAGSCEGVNDRVTLNARNFLISRGSISFSINTNLTEMTNKKQLCRTIYYSIVP